jgi:hypothetical protein
MFKHLTVKKPTKAEPNNGIEKRRSRVGSSFCFTP